MRSEKTPLPGRRIERPLHVVRLRFIVCEDWRRQQPIMLKADKIDADFTLHLWRDEIQKPGDTEFVDAEILNALKSVTSVVEWDALTALQRKCEVNSFLFRHVER